MGKLHIADNFALPLEAVTEKLAWLGRTGSGKSYGAQKLAEEMHRADAQFIVIDPVGIWYGLRLAADGKSPGLSIPVLGGLHGDIPLEPGAGAMIANLIVDRGVSIILDVSQFESDADKARFAHAFADRFYFRKKSSPSAVHIFVEESQEFIPQNPQREEARMLHAFTRIQKLGRNFGIGTSLISQRPQEVNKKALNQTELLFAFQMTGPQERKTLQGWIADKGIDEDIDAVLPKLERGCPHVWSPAWLKISRVIQIGRKTTFDASSTPKVGKKADARELSPIDLERLRTDMAATIERAKADDPRELRKQISDLKRQLAEKKPPAQTVPDPQAIQRAVAKAKDDAAKDYNRRLADGRRKLQKAAELLTDALGSVTPPGITEGLQELRRIVTSPVPAPVAQRRHAPEPSTNGHSHAPDIGGGGLRRMLIALAQRPQGLSSKQLGVRTGLSSKSGTFTTYLGKARSEGWIDGKKDRLAITDAGLSALGHYDPLPTGQELLGHWLGELGDSGAARMLRALAEVYPQGMTKDVLGEAAGLSQSGTFTTYLGKLRSLELVEGRGEIRASEELFQ